MSEKLLPYEHYDRLEAMVEDNGYKWDFSDNDRAALRWALGEIHDSRSLPAAIETVWEAITPERAGAMMRMGAFAAGGQDRVSEAGAQQIARAMLDALAEPLSPDSASPAPDTPDSGDGPPERHTGAER